MFHFYKIFSFAILGVELRSCFYFETRSQKVTQAALVSICSRLADLELVIFQLQSISGCDFLSQYHQVHLTSFYYWVTLLCWYTGLCFSTYQLLVGHFLFLVLWTNTALGIGHLSLCLIPCFKFFGYLPRSGIIKLYGICISKFLRISQKLHPWH